MAKTRIEVLLIVDHDDDIGQDELHAACEDRLPGLQLMEGVPVMVDGKVTLEGKVTYSHSAIVDDVETVWVKG